MDMHTMLMALRKMAHLVAQYAQKTSTGARKFESCPATTSSTLNAWIRGCLTYPVPVHCVVVTCVQQLPRVKRPRTTTLLLLQLQRTALPPSLRLLKWMGLVVKHL